MSSTMYKAIEAILIKVAKNGTKGTTKEKINRRVIIQAREDILKVTRGYYD